MSDLVLNPDNGLAKLRPVTRCREAGFTRPNDTTAYADGDVICDSTTSPTILTFTGMARGAGLGGVIQNAVLVQSTAQATKLKADLFLFDTDPGISNDNAAFAAASDAELEKCIGVITFDGTSGTQGFRSTANGGLTDTGAVSKAYQCASGSTTLYGVLVARNSYTPGAQEVFRVRLFALLD